MLLCVSCAVGAARPSKPLALGESAGSGGDATGARRVPAPYVQEFIDPMRLRSAVHVGRWCR